MFLVPNFFKNISEATRRAIKQAENEDCVAVDLENVEKILPQLVSTVYFRSQ